MPSERTDAPAPGPVLRGLSYAVLLVLTLLLAVWGAFLVPLRVRDVPVPVGVVLALATVPLCRRGGALLDSRLGAGGPLAVWTGAAVLLSSARSEGDLVLAESVRGIAFLLLGLLGGAAAVGTWQPREARARPLAAPVRHRVRR